MVFARLTVDAVNRAARTLEGVAGKSVNVAKVLRVLGEYPIATGFLGGQHGEFVRTTLEECGIMCAFVHVTVPTRQCVTLLDQAAGTVTELVEESRPVASEDYDRLRAIIPQHLRECAALVMSGTITPSGPPGFYGECTQLARRAGRLAVVDAQGPALLEALSARPGLVKPNRAELAATVGRDLKDEAALKTAMRELAERGADRVVVTAGSRATLAFESGRYWRVIPPPVLAVNPIGSGDAFTAGVVARLTRGDDLGEACRWGTAAGAANALTFLAGEVNRDDVERFVPQINVQLEPTP